jgi:glycosidase
MLWADIAYDDETQGFRGPLLKANPRAPDMDLFAFYQRLIAIRKEQPALRRGSFRWVPAPGDATIAFERQFGSDTIWCALHKGAEGVEIELPRPARDLWTGADLPAGPLRIPANGFRIVMF